MDVYITCVVFPLISHLGFVFVDDFFADLPTYHRPESPTVYVWEFFPFGILGVCPRGMLEFS